MEPAWRHARIWASRSRPASRAEIREETGLEVDVGPVVEVFDRILLDTDGRVRYHFVLIDYVCRPIGGTLQAGSDRRRCGAGRSRRARAVPPDAESRGRDRARAHDGAGAVGLTSGVTTLGRSCGKPATVASPSGGMRNGVPPERPDIPRPPRRPCPRAAGANRASAGEARTHVPDWLTCRSPELKEMLEAEGARVRERIEQRLVDLGRPTTEASVRTIDRVQAQQRCWCGAGIMLSVLGAAPRHPMPPVTVAGRPTSPVARDGRTGVVARPTPPPSPPVRALRTDLATVTQRTTSSPSYRTKHRAPSTARNTKAPGTARSTSTGTRHGASVSFSGFHAK